MSDYHLNREEIDDEVCALMMDHGPDGHIDGHDMLTEMVVRRVAAERERWKAMMRRAIATCFHRSAHHEVMSDATHFAAEALRPNVEAQGPAL